MTLSIRIDPDREGPGQTRHCDHLHSMTQSHTDAPLTLTAENGDDVHEEAAAVLTVVYGVAATLEAIRSRVEAGEAPETLAQEHVDALRRAFRTGQWILNHDAYEAFLQEGLAGLPEELVAEIREGIAPFAHIYGVDLEHAGDDVDLADSVAVDVGRRGS